MSENSETILSTGKRAFPLMLKHAVDPTPSNYAVWYHYVASQNEKLVKEIDALIASAAAFTPDTNNYLYEKYAAEQGDKQIVEDATLSAKNLLSEILGVINTFKGETTHYGQELDTHIDTMSGKFAQSPLQDMVKEIIAGAAALKSSGVNLNQKLDESRQEIENLKANLAQITTESQKDFLTGVANRKALERRLDEETQQVRDEGGDLCLLMIDIDHFKQFNDKFGHLIGDEVLKIVAKSLTDSVKGHDMVARYGGEEFSVLLPSTPLGGAMIVAEKIRQTIASRDLKRRDTGQSYGAITVSIGVSYFHAENDTVPLFIKRADEALYRSKKSGRNRVTQETLS